MHNYYAISNFLLENNTIEKVNDLYIDGFRVKSIDKEPDETFIKLISIIDTDAYILLRILKNKQKAYITYFKGIKRNSILEIPFSNYDELQKKLIHWSSFINTRFNDLEKSI